MFISSSTDGLIAVFDLSEKFDEEDSFVAAINIMDSVTSFGFCGASGDHLWCRTLTEAFHLWDWKAACSEEAPGGEAPYVSFSDTRERLSQLAAPMLPGGVECLVDCCYDASSNAVRVCAGSNSGDLIIFPVPLGSNSDFSQPTALLTGGHNESVRCLSWPSGSPLECISGGEDGKIVAWTSGDQAKEQSEGISLKKSKTSRQIEKKRRTAL